MIGKLLRKILTPSPKGLIELYGLQDWYQSLAAETRVKIKTYYTLGTQGNSDEVDIVHPNTLVIKHRGSQRFLGVIGFMLAPVSVTGFVQKYVFPTTP